MEEKADYLFLLIGTNPLPNLISAFTRVKNGGDIYLCCTSGYKGESETKDIAEKIQKIIDKKQISNPLGIKTNILVLDKSRIENIVAAIDSKLSQLKRFKDKKAVIELNYTGGTKAMSAGAYFSFKKFIQDAENIKYFDVFMTYIDGEREEIIYEIFKNREMEYKKESLKKLVAAFPIKISDIASIHKNEIMSDYGDYSVEPFDYKLSEKFFNLFIDCDDSQYENNIKYSSYIYDEKCKPYNGKKVKYIERDWPEINRIDFDKINDFNIFPDIKTLEDFFDTEKKEKRLQYIEHLGGKWLEDYCLKILLEFKHEGLISDAAKSIKSNDSRKFEIDIVAYRNFKLFGISATTIETLDEARPKLYEIKERARQIGGLEAGICFVSLLRYSKDLEREIKNAWNDEINKNILVIGTDRFRNIKEYLRSWIVR